MAEPAAPRLPNYIDGNWVGVHGVESLADIDPATGKTLARVPLSRAAEVEAAVAAAQAAQPGWSALSPQRRAQAVLRLREELLERREELTRLVSLDMGKTLADAEAEVGRGLESVEAAAAIPHLLKGETLVGVAAGVDVESLRQPVGVVAAITPFNFPAMIPLWFIPFAIACGNSFVLKPSELDPRPAALISAAVHAVEEIPPGVFNLIHGAHAAVNALLDHPEVDAISFVGQATTARMVAERGVGGGKRVQALGGAKNSLVVMPDADLEQAMPAIMGSAFGAAGQRCLAGSVCVSVGDRPGAPNCGKCWSQPRRRCASGPGLTPPPTSVPWSRRRRASAWWRRSTVPRRRAPSCCSTVAATPARRAPHSAPPSPSPPIASRSWRARSSSGRC